jgi:hypothetical protein
MTEQMMAVIVLDTGCMDVVVGRSCRTGQWQAAVQQEPREGAVIVSIAGMQLINDQIPKSIADEGRASKVHHSRYVLPNRAKDHPSAHSSAQTNLRQDALNRQQLGRKSDHKPKHGQTTIPGLSKFDKTKTGSLVRHDDLTCKVEKGLVATVSLGAPVAT